MKREEMTGNNRKAWKEKKVRTEKEEREEKEIWIEASFNLHCPW